MPRAFIAAPIANVYWPELQTVQHQLQVAGFQYRLIRPTNFHMTVAFIGEVSTAELQKIHQKTKSVLEGFKPLSLTARTVTGFPTTARTRAVAVKLGGRNSTKLQRQASKVREQLRKLDVTFDTVPFIPHITIGRTDRGKDFSARLPAVIEMFDVQVDQLNLCVSSISADNRVEYVTAERYLSDLSG